MCRLTCNISVRVSQLRLRRRFTSAGENEFPDVSGRLFAQLDGGQLLDGSCRNAKFLSWNLLLEVAIM